MTFWWHIFCLRREHGSIMPHRHFSKETILTESLRMSFRWSANLSPWQWLSCWDTWLSEQLGVPSRIQIRIGFGTYPRNVRSDSQKDNVETHSLSTSFCNEVSDAGVHRLIDARNNGKHFHSNYLYWRHFLMSRLMDSMASSPWHPHSNQNVYIWAHRYILIHARS